MASKYLLFPSSFILKEYSSSEKPWLTPRNCTKKSIDRNRKDISKKSPKSFEERSPIRINIDRVAKR
jgi:hypothetical protein